MTSGPHTARRRVRRFAFAAAASALALTACDPGTTQSTPPTPVVSADAPAGHASPVAFPPSSAPHDGDRAALLTAASAAYGETVQQHVESLVARTASFADAYIERDDDRARDEYLAARAHWLAIEPIFAESPHVGLAIDAREADLHPTEQWTGWHHAEKDLWPPAGFALTDAERSDLAEQLIADTDRAANEATDAIAGLDAPAIARIATSLLRDASVRAVTGDEEVWSGADLWAVRAQTDGARAAFSALRPALEHADAPLTATIAERFAALDDALARHGSPARGYPAHGDLTTNEVRDLARAVDALAEPLSRLADAVVS